MHEHLDDYGIINMNGRVYDPQTAKFFSPDPFVQAPDNWVNYNRYGYCFNNPLIYSDPSGYVNEASVWRLMEQGYSYSEANSIGGAGGGAYGNRGWGGGGSSASGHYEEVSSTTLIRYYYSINLQTGAHENMNFLYQNDVTSQWVWNSPQDGMYAAVHPEMNVNTTHRTAIDINYYKGLSVKYYADTKITHDKTTLKTITSDLKGKELSVSWGPYSEGVDGSYMIGMLGFNPTNGDLFFNLALNPLSNTTYGAEIHVNVDVEELLNKLITTAVEHPEVIIEAATETAY